MAVLELVQPTEEDLLKRCTKCGSLKRLAEFHKDKTHSDGHKSWCTDCSHERNIARRRNKTYRRAPKLENLDLQEQAWLGAVSRLIETYDNLFEKLLYSERVRLGVQDLIPQVRNISAISMR